MIMPPALRRSAPWPYGIFCTQRVPVFDREDAPGQDSGPGRACGPVSYRQTSPAVAPNPGNRATPVERFSRWYGLNLDWHWGVDRNPGRVRGVNYPLVCLGRTRSRIEAVILGALVSVSIVAPSINDLVCSANRVSYVHLRYVQVTA